MSDAKVRVETRQPPSGDGRQISARRHGSADLSDHEDDLRAAIQSVLATVTRALKDTPTVPLRVGGLEVGFNVAFTPGEGAYLCSSPADGTFSVKLSLAFSEPGSASSAPAPDKGAAETRPSSAG
ncbi:hypothetical protein SAMN05421811_122177 [Nonomuraea wenchangensis]|uniref:Trypsin-co-occurring domain-containing protein n=1 Tax=Nonomuraea wenchangensis TaxID=568860 RepID=A0A1I0LQH2_9ACTN|nr:hypothetical protein SAMN05421811_122177 [Nonomuraea wenchangensis]